MQPDDIVGEVESKDAHAEIRAFLSEDESRLGDVFRCLERGLTPDETAVELGVSTSNFVWNYTRIIDSLLERDLPNAPTVAQQVGRKYRSLLKHDWSVHVRERLEDDLSTLEKRSGDVEALAEEAEAARKQTEAAENSAQTGIYVYSLPHYLRYPFDRESGRTLLKVGRSDRDVMQRMRDQTRTTALPEEPVLLRIYPTGDTNTTQIESQFHRTLQAFDHGRKVQRMAGREWFLTTTVALDAVAALLGLRPEVINDDADYIDEF